jgi:hypothetical protein
VYVNEVSFFDRVLFFSLQNKNKNYSQNANEKEKENVNDSTFLVCFFTTLFVFCCCLLNLI